MFAVAIAASGQAESASLLGLGSKDGVLGTGVLSGNGSDNSTTLAVTVGAGGLLGSGAAASAAASSGDDGNGNVLVDLFGNGGDLGNVGLSLDVGLGDGGVGAGATVGGSNVTLDLFGDGTGPATVPDATAPNAVASNLFGAASAQGPAEPPASRCFTPNAHQLSQLVGRHSYDSTTFQDWSGASTIKVIDAGVCDSAAARIDAQQNIGRLQDYVTGDAQLRAQLAQWGHRPGDVIAIDKQGRTLIVYVD